MSDARAPTSPPPLATPLPCWHESMLSARHDLVVALSDRRARIATDRPLPAGTAVFLEFADGACVDAIATDGGDAAGFVVEFVAVDPRAAEIMAQALRPAPLPVVAPAVAVAPITMSPQVAAFLSDRADSAEAEDGAVDAGVDLDLDVDVDLDVDLDGGDAEAAGAAEADVVEAAFAEIEKPLPRTRTDELFVGVTTPGGTSVVGLAEVGPSAAPPAKTPPATLVAFDLPPVTRVPAEHESPVVEAADSDGRRAAPENTTLRSHTATLTPMMAVTAPPVAAPAPETPAQAPADPFVGGFDVPFTGSFVQAPPPAGGANDWTKPGNEPPGVPTLAEPATATTATTTSSATLHEGPGPSWSPRSLNTDIGEDDSSPVEQTQRWPTARVAEVVNSSLLPLSVTPTPGVLPTLQVSAEDARTPTPRPAPVSRPFSGVDDEPIEQTQRWPAARAKLREVLAVEAAVEASAPSAAAVPTPPPEAGGEEGDTLDAAFRDAFSDDVAMDQGAAPALGAPVAVVDDAIDITMEFTGARAQVNVVSLLPMTRPLPEPEGGVIDVDFSEFADVLGVATFKSEAPPLVSPSSVSRIATPHPVSVSLPRTPSALSTTLATAAPIERNPFAGDSGKRARDDSTPPTTPAVPSTSLQELWVASSPQTTLPTPRLLDQELDPVLRAGGRGSSPPRPQATGDATPWTIGRDSSTPQAMPFVGDTPAPTSVPTPAPATRPTPPPASISALAAAPATPVPKETLATAPQPRPPAPPPKPPVAPTLPWSAPARAAVPPPAPPPEVGWPSLSPTMAPATAPDPFASLAQPTALGNRVTPTGPTLGTAAVAGGAPGAQVLPLSPSSEGLPLIVGDDDDDDIPVVMGGEAFDIDDIGDIDDDNGPR